MPHFFVHQGPHYNGQQLLLDREKTTVGREKGCHILLPSDPANQKKKDVISRKHAVVLKDGDKYYIKDGDGDARPSHNGTYVNQERIQLPGRTMLKNGDVVQICDYIFIFYDGVPVPEEDNDSSSDHELAIPHDDSSVILAQPAEKLQLLLDITNRLSRTLELDTLLPQVVETLLHLFKQADRVFLILVDEATGALDARVFKTRRREDETRFPVSIVKKCLDMKHALLSNNPVEDFDSGSVAGLALRSVMCAPLLSSGGKPFGVLLLDRYHARNLFAADDLNLLLGVAKQAAIALENANYHEAALVWEQHKRDLALAREVVKSFLPERLPAIPDYQFFASYESALEVGGDYYDMIPTANNRLGILVGDVTGKGVAAALVMARFSAEVRACLRREKELAAAVSHLNALMQPLGLVDKFITLAVMQLDPESHRLTLVNAGHPLPLLLRANGVIEEMGTRANAGLPLGVMPGHEYQAHHFTLEPGDRVVMYSDGVTDALDANGHWFDIVGLRTVLEGSSAPPPELGENILRAIDKHAAGCPQYDDTTLVCLGRTN